MSSDQEHGDSAKSIGETVFSWLGEKLSGKPPDGLLGVHWGDDVQSAAEKIGTQAVQWNPWVGGQGFEAAYDPDHPIEAFGALTRVRLIRKDGKLAAISLRFRDCGSSRPALTKAISHQLHVTSADGNPYQVFADGSVVRLEYDPGDNTCELTVTGPEFGKAYTRQQLGAGLGTLAKGLGPE
jgi:hypothetical protein